MGTKKADWTKALPILDAKAAMNFWSNVKQRATNECWPWAAGHFTNSKGVPDYGAAVLRFTDGKSRPRHASKVAWAFANERWPNENEVVMHSVCDNPPCCNPRHLTLGTNNSNMADMAAKGRASQGDEHYSRVAPEKLARGSKVGTSKLTEQDVLIIKVAVVGFTTQDRELPRGFKTFLAEQFSVTKQMIGFICTGKWWDHVGLTLDMLEVASFDGSFEEVLSMARAVTTDDIYREKIKRDKREAEAD